MKKLLIIKMGYSETLDSEASKIVSIGDVLRCTVILEPLKERFPSSHITWLVSQESLRLVAGNPLIDRVLVWDEFLPYALMREQYDMVINLEKINGVCALADMIQAWEKAGFRFNAQSGTFDTYAQSMIAKHYIQNKDEKGERGIWQEIVLGMLGLEWKGQEYSLGYQPKSPERFDVGLNWKVGKKWPTKGMSEERWSALEALLVQEGLSVSWQQGMEDLSEYIEWIHQCRVVISSDSLGLHLALALKKGVVGLFGATDEQEVYFYGRGSAVKAEPQPCMPCYKPVCESTTFCMDAIDLDAVVRVVRSVHSRRAHGAA